MSTIISTHLAIERRWKVVEEVHPFNSLELADMVVNFVKAEKARRKDEEECRGAGSEVGGVYTCTTEAAFGYFGDGETPAVPKKLLVKKPRR